MERLKTINISNSKAPLANGFGGFIKRLSTKLGALPDAADVAGEAAKVCIAALSEGDVCAEVQTLAKSLGRSEEEIRALFLSSNVTASSIEDRKLPLVLDDKGRIYLYRYFDYERQLANAIVARIPKAPPQPLNTESQKFLDERFAENAKRLAGRPDRQKMAVMLALSSPLTIISGGPGTGKTTIVTALIATLALNDPPPRIALVAPTGKAAARMEDAMRKQVSTLSPELIKRLPDHASTIHMLLGAKPASNEFRHNRDNPLPYDLIVIDEASMIDLSLAARLFTALLPGTRIVLLGDKDQLAAVEAGAVFAELARRSSLSDVTAEDPDRKKDDLLSLRPSPGTEKKGISDCVVWLTENYRFGAESPIGRLAALVVNGNDAQMTDWLQTQKSSEIKWEAIGDGLPAKVVDALVCGFESYVAAVKQGDPGDVLSIYEKFCVLCAIRRGKRGVEGINDVIAQKLRLRLSGEISSDSHWYNGRPVMITENDYGLGIFNGDIGIALTGKNGNLDVWFKAKEGGIRSISPSSLPAHQTAFAITIHKAQGSEFENVALILPEQDSPVLTRELIYTAVTRARKSLSLYGSLKIMSVAVCRPTSRRSGLAERITLLEG